MKIILTGFCLLLSAVIFAQQPAVKDSLPEMIRGSFMDDYKIRYIITDTLFTQLPSSKYHILEHNSKEQYLITRNGSGNKTDAGLYTRIDYMQFSGMEPFHWGFCLTVYKAASAEEAMKATPADRQNPRKGCNGFPFSRMKRTDAGQ